MGQPNLEEMISESLEQPKDQVVHQLAREIIRLRNAPVVLPDRAKIIAVMPVSGHVKVIRSRTLESDPPDGLGES